MVRVGNHHFCCKRGELQGELVASMTTRATLIALTILAFAAGTAIYFHGQYLFPKVFATSSHRILGAGISGGVGVSLGIGAILSLVLRKKVASSSAPSDRVKVGKEYLYHHEISSRGKNLGAACYGRGNLDSILEKIQKASSFSESKLAEVIDFPAVVWVKDQQCCKIFGLHGIQFSINTDWGPPQGTGILDQTRKVASEEGLPVANIINIGINEKFIMINASAGDQD